MALADIPFYGAYTQRRQMNEQAPLQELQQAGGAMSLLAQLQKQEQAGQLREALAATGGDVEKALEVAVRTGNIDAAHQLAPLVKLAQERRQGEETRRGLAALQAPPVPATNPMVPGPGASVMAGGGETTPSASAPQNQTQTRIEHLNKLSTLYATNPVVVQRIQAEIDKLQRDADRAPQKRERIEGETLVQEEFKDGKFVEVGRGPRFARQVAGVNTTQEPLVPVKEPDGRVIYVPRSQAAGREVGGRITDVNLGKQVQQLGRDLEKADLPPTIAVLRRAEAITPETAAYITGPRSALPDRAIPKEARDARQDVQRLFNITLKQRSGAAVTNQELDRLKQEFGTGIIKTPDQLIGAIGRMREIIENHYTGIAGGYGKDALDTYNANVEAVGGTPFELRPKASPGAPPQSGAPRPPQSGLPTVTNEAEYNALPSGAVYIAPDGKTKRKR